MSLFRLALTLLLTAAPIIAAQTVTPPPVTNLANLKWETISELPPCFKVAIVKGDPYKGASVVALKVSDGCGETWHWHSVTETATMISGTFKLQMRDSKKPIFLKSGGFSVLPAKQQHREVCLGQCLLYVIMDAPMDLHYVDDAGKELPLEQGVKRSEQSAKF